MNDYEKQIAKVLFSLEKLINLPGWTFAGPIATEAKFVVNKVAK